MSQSDPLVDPSGGPVAELPLSEQPLFCEQWINAPVDAVFDFLVDHEKLSRWLGHFAEAPSVGEPYDLTVGLDGHVAQGEFLEIEPPHKVVFSWGWSHFEAVPSGSTIVTITLSEVDGGTTVLLRHDGLPLGPEDIHATGWRECLDRLVGVFDQRS